MGEGLGGRDMRVPVWLIHVDVWQGLAQYLANYPPIKKKSSQTLLTMLQAMCYFQPLPGEVAETET